MNRKQLFLLQMASLLFSSLTFSYVLTGRLIGVVSVLALFGDSASCGVGLAAHRRC